MDSGGTPRLTRRDLVGRGLGGALALSGLTAGRGGAAGPRGLTDGRFASGVASGDPKTGGITLWTRLHDVDRGGPIRFEVARDRGFGRVVAAGKAEVRPEADFTARVPAGGLEPGAEYFYRFHTRHSDSPVGRFRTLRPPDSREPVRVAFYSCQDYEQGFFTSHQGLAGERDLDLVVCLGDYIYERPGADPRVRLDRSGHERNGDCQSLSDYRAKHRLYRADRHLQAMHAAHPHVAFWDSHDIEPTGNGSAEVDQYGRARRVTHAQRLRAGKRAFLENMPQTPPASDRDRMYGSISLGRHADLFLTDEQLYRDSYPCAFSFPPKPCPEAEAPGRRYLGTRQLRWLKRRLERSPATWKLYAGGTMMMGLKLLGSPFNTGQWDGYVAERRELMEFVLGREIENVVRMSGDIHTFFAGVVTTTGDSAGRPAATEFIGSSISSFGIPEGLSSGSGGLVDRALAAALSEQLPLINRHLAYTEQRHRGYLVAECRPDELIVELRSPRTTFEPSSEMFTLRRFRVPAGRPMVERA